MTPDKNGPWSNEGVPCTPQSARTGATLLDAV